LWFGGRFPKEGNVKKAFLPENLVKNLEIAGFLQEFCAFFLIFFFAMLFLCV